MRYKVKEGGPGKWEKFQRSENDGRRISTDLVEIDVEDIDRRGDDYNHTTPAPAYNEGTPLNLSTAC